MSRVERRVCRLHLAVGSVETCPGSECPFWEEGGDFDPDCGLEHLGLDLDRPDLADYLLELRRALEEARTLKERDTVRRAFSQLVPPDMSGR